MILDPISLYCERTGPGPWDEPFSLIAGLAFVPAAWALWTWSRDLPQLWPMALLTLVLVPASTLLHIRPTLLAVVLNLTPVLALILYCFFLLSRDALHLSRLMAVLCTVLILPFATVSLLMIGIVHGAVSTAAYAAVLILILGYAAILRQEAPATAQGLFLAGLIMVLAMAARTADMPLCGVWSHGTHFLWIIGSALLLAQLGRVYHRHMLAGQGRGG